MSENRPPAERHLPPPEEFGLADLPPSSSDQAIIHPRVDSDGLIVSHGPTFKDEFQIDAPEVDTSEYEKLLPPEGLSPAVRRALVAPPIPVTVEEEPERPLTQFTMTELFWLMSFLSVGFAVMYYLPPDQVAGVLGLLALIGQGLLMRFPPEHRHIRMGATVLLLMYICAAAVAFITHLMGWNS